MSDTAAPAPPGGHLSDDYPVLLGPVRIETRFTATELQVRVFPDEWSVDAFEPKRTQHEHGLALGYWRRVWQAGGDRDGRRAAWRDLVASVGAGRAPWIIEQRKPVNPGDEPRRTHPGQVILVMATDDPLPASDRGPAATYWTAIYRADGTRGAVQAADAALDAALPAARAAAVRARRPAGLDGPVPPGGKASADVTVSFLDLAKVSETDTKPASWTSAARARLLPDTFTLLGYAGGRLVVNVTGSGVPDSLAVSPDPSTPLGDQLRSEDGALHVPDDLAWLTDFDRAVRVGMGFRVPLTSEIRGGLDRLIVLGLRARSAPDQARIDLETLIGHQSRSRTGYRLLPQGTPTNNTGRTPSGFGREDEAETSFAAVFERPADGVPSDDWLQKTDGQWLAELLGIDPKVLRQVQGADGTDQREARAMNIALWPATWGYHLHTMLHPIFDTEAVDATRSFFTRYVSGRGPIPAIQIGRQPYGILPTTAFSRLDWTAGAEGTPHRQRLNAVLSAAHEDWTSLAAGVAHLGAGGDPHRLLLDMLGLHPTSAELYQRYAQSTEDYYNRQNLSGQGGEVLDALVALGMSGRVRALLTRLGYDSQAPDPDATGRLFVERQHALRGPLIDDRPLSETDAVRSYTNDGRNYLAWLAHYARRDFEAVRVEDGFTADRPPAALLYLLMRQAILIAFHEAGLRLAADAHGDDERALRAARREPPFVHVSERSQVSESRYRHLYAKDPDVTGDPDMLIAELIPRIVGQRPATRDLAAHVEAIEMLAEVPTARLERVLMEHLDCCTYRLDAWRLGLVNEKLFELRYGAGHQGGGGHGAKTGLHLGAYGWLENVRPRSTPLTEVQLSGELGEIFTPPGSPPLLHDPGNGGYVHAPSLNHATTAALLRTGYLANASRDNPGTMAVNLSSERVRIALSFLDGIRGGQSLGALFGYRLERGLHDRHGPVEIDAFIAALREAFPLSAGRLPETIPPPGTAIESIEARGVVDGLALVRHVTRTGQPHYPFGKLGLPDASADQAAAIDAEVQRLVEIQDALADLAVAESMHQAVLGNADRAGATLDAFTRSGSPPEPTVVRTPRSGLRLNHRVGLHLRGGLSPTASPIDGLAMTPRACADPAINDWLAGLLPDPADVACQVRWTDPVTGTARSRVVSQAELGLQPIDLLWTLRLQDEAGMTDLDDRVVGRVQQAETLRPDVELGIRYTERIAGRLTFFELSPLVASLRSLLVQVRSLRPSDVVRPASGDPIDSQLDDRVDLPRNRPSAVRDAQRELQSAMDSYVTDLGGLLADPAANRAALLAGMDGFLTRLAILLIAGNSFGLVRSGWGELTMWRRGAFRNVLAAVRETADRMAGSLASADAKLETYDALSATTPDVDRFALLQQAERLLTTAPTSPRPATPAALRTIVGGRRTTFANRVSALTASRSTTRATLSGLQADVAGLLPLTGLDPIGLDLTSHEDAVLAFCADLLGRARGARDEIVGRLAAAESALASYDGSAGGPARAAAAVAALRAMLGPDALATSELTVPVAMGNDWRIALTASEDGKLTQHLARDFPVDDWLHGLARVRSKLALWERITLLAGAVGRKEPVLSPIQFPYRAGDPWLGLEIPTGQVVDSDRLLYTAHYTKPFKANDTQCAVLIDEWIETVPAAAETTGIAFHHDRPGAEPPQVMLLVTPPQQTGAWAWDDLVAALHDTLDMARTRAVEPGHLDGTAYAQLLPATVMPATPQPITISTDLATNNLPPTER